MNDDNKKPVFEKILEIFSNFGESITNIESQLDNLNQTVRRLEYKLDELIKGQKEEDFSIEGEYKQLEKKISTPIFSKEELKDLRDMENEYKNLEDDSDLNDDSDMNDIKENIE